VLDGLDPEGAMTESGRRAKRGHRNGPRPVALPDRWYELADSDELLDPSADVLVSGG
jgi:hypothetical protein